MGKSQVSENGQMSSFSCKTSENYIALKEIAKTY